MLKNRVFTAFALVALVGAAACGDSADSELNEEQEPQFTTEEETVAPEAVEGTVIMDTAGAGTVIDTTTVPPQN